ATGWRRSRRGSYEYWHRDARLLAGHRRIGVGDEVAAAIGGAGQRGLHLEPTRRGDALTGRGAGQEGATAIALTQEQVDAGDATTVSRGGIEGDARDDVVAIGQEVARIGIGQLEDRRSGRTGGCSGGALRAKRGSTK